MVDDELADWLLRIPSRGPAHRIAQPCLYNISHRWAHIHTLTGTAINKQGITVHGKLSLSSIPPVKRLIKNAAKRNKNHDSSNNNNNKKKNLWILFNLFSFRRRVLCHYIIQSREDDSQIGFFSNMHLYKELLACTTTTSWCMRQLRNALTPFTMHKQPKLIGKSCKHGT